MEILSAYDLTGSYRAAAELCGCSHHTVKKAVEERDAGLPGRWRSADCDLPSGGVEQRRWPVRLLALAEPPM